MTANEYRTQVAEREARGYDRTISGTALDAGITFLKSAIGLPEAFVGLADIPTLGRVGKLLEQAGYKPNEAKEILDTYLSEAQQYANRQVKETKGFLPTIGKALQYPSTIVTTVGESIAPMLGGAGIARGVLKAAPKVAPYLAAAAGEGLIGAGSAAEQIRQQTEDKLLTGKQALSAVGSGVGTAVFGVAGGKLAKKFGFDDIDTLLASKATTGGGSKSVKDFAVRATAAGVTEGLFEEMPQSAQEQVWMNYATDKPLLQGVPEAAGMGLVTGATMGVGATALKGRRREEPAAPVEKIEPTLEPEKTAPAVDKRQALKDAIAKRVEPTATEVQPAPLEIPELETLIAKYKKRGYMPEDAATLARNEIEELTPKKVRPKGVPEVEKWTDAALSSTLKLQQSKPDTAPTMVTADTPIEQRSAKNKPLIEAIETEIATREKNKGPTNVAEPVSEPSGGRVAVPAQPAVDVPAPARVEQAEPDGVVPAKPDAGELADGKGTQPVAVTPAPAVVDKRQALKDAIAKRIKPTPPTEGTTTDGTQAPKAQQATQEKQEAATAGVTAKSAAEQHKAARPSYGEPQTPERKAFSQWEREQIILDKEAQLEALQGRDESTINWNRDWEGDTQVRSLADARAEIADLRKRYELPAPTTAAAGVAPAKPRGRPKAAITEEQRAEKETTRKEGRTEYMRGERALPKLQAKLEEAAAPIDETNIADDEALTAAVNEKRVLKRDTINAMLDLEAKHRGTALGKRVKAALADRSKISQKDYDDVSAGRKYKQQERVNKSTASNEEVEDANEGFKQAKNAAQALNQVIKTGTDTQKLLAKRLRGFVNGVKFVVVEETDPLPEQLSRHQEAWGNDNSRARGVYFENTATGERVVFVRGSSAGGFQGINNTTVLHEMLHAATQQKLELARLAVTRGFSTDAKLTRAYNDLIEVMNNAKDEYNRLSKLGQLPTDIYFLKTVSGVFSNPHEFVSYGMTDPYFQKFLMGAYGTKEDTSFFTRFVDAIREMLGMGLDTVNALSDLILVTDKILSSKLTPTMQMIAKADKANAVRESRNEKVSAAKANAKKVSAAEKKVLRSKEAQEVVDGIDTLVTLRDPALMMDVLKGGWNAFNVTKLKALLPALQTSVIVEWGDNLGIKHLNETRRAMQDMGAMRMKMLGGASDVVSKWLNVQPGLYGKLIKGKKNELADLSAVMHYATDKSIDPAKSRKDATLNKMWDGLSDTAKEIYVDVRDYYKSNFDLYRLLLNERIDAMKIPGEAADPDTPKGKLMAEIKKMYETAKGMSPYFPLMRYGDYWLRVGSGKKKEFYMFESVIDRELFLAKRVRQLQAEGDTRSEKEMKADQDIETGNDLKGLRDKSATNETAPLLKEIFELIGDGIGELDAETLKDQIYQLYLTTMPEQSFRRQFIHRKGTTGFSGDALRNFITSSTNMANQLARLKYGPKMIREVDAAKESLKGNPEKDKLEMLVNELGERVQLEVYPPAADATARGVANFANKAAFLYFMTSVKTAVVQFSSLPIMGAPVLMSRHSPAGVLAEMGKMMLVFNDVGVMDKDGNFKQLSLANSRRVKMNEEEQRAIEAMTDRGVSETTMAYDLMDRGDTPSNKYSGAWKSATNMMGGLFHHVERLNREIMFMTSFRLSRKGGMSFDDAVEQAVKDTYDALGNFSEQERPRIMRGPVGRTMLQFKTFPLFVSTYLVRNGYRAMAGMDAAAKKEAATQLFGTLFMSGLLAGYVGVPGISAAMGAIQGIINAMRDEEDEDPLEERDLEFWFRSVFVPEFFGEAQIGGYKISDIIDTGLIDTITGYNMSNSLAMNNMWMPELKEQRALEDTVQEYALSLMGPFASLTLNQIPSGIRLLQEGKTMQGLERLLPAFLRQPLVAVRYGQEGATTTTGAVIREPEEFTKAQLVAQAAGARTTGLASTQEANFKANALKAKVVLEKGKLVNRVDLESTRGSDEEFDAALEKLLVFNARNPQLAVKGEQLSNMLQARMEKRLKADRGFDVDKKFYPYLEELLAPSRERLDKEAAK
jgi:hypothetical protein